MSTILDSGNRRTFDSGAVRDIQEGKGRCDLMPLQVACRIRSVGISVDFVLEKIAQFQYDNKTHHLYAALDHFSRTAFGGCVETMLLEVAKHFESGAIKYGENNWQKGLPVNCYIDSAVRHYLKYKRGDNDEPHHRAFVWNLMCCIWEVDFHAE